MNHRVFERKLRPRLRSRACLPQRRFTPSPFSSSTEGEKEDLVVSIVTIESAEMQKGPPLSEDVRKVVLSLGVRAVGALTAGERTDFDLSSGKGTR